MSSRPARGAARLAAILDALPDALLLVNGNGTIVTANTIAVETLEAPGAPVVGRGLLDIVPDFDPRRIPGSMRRPEEDPAARTKPTRMIARRTDGTELPVEVTSAGLSEQRSPYASAIDAAFADDFAGDYPGEELLVLVVRDLSGTLDTEAELVRQQRQTEMILRAASEGVVGVDTAGRVVLVNPAAAQLLGHRASQLGGQELHPLVQHSRADGSPLAFEETPLYDTLHSGRKHRVRGQVLWAKDGRAIPVDLTTAPVRDGDQLVGAVLTFTDRRRYDALSARHAQLRSVLDESLLGPLMELREELQTLASDPAGQLWPEANQVLHHLAAGYSRMTTLVENVLGYQRLDDGSAELAIRQVSLESVVADGVEGATELIGPGRAQFAVHAPPIAAAVDPERMALALAHLVADVAGVDATGRTSHPGVPAGDSTIVVAAAQRGDVVRIEVRGPHRGGHPVHEPIVRGIVRQHGGVLQTHAVPGAAGGHAYVLEVPVAAAGTSATPALGPGRDASGDTTVMPVPAQPARGTAGAAGTAAGGGLTPSGATPTGETSPPEQVPAGRQPVEQRPVAQVPDTPTGRRRRAKPFQELSPDGDEDGEISDGGDGNAAAGAGRRRRALVAVEPAPQADPHSVTDPDAATAAGTGRRRRAQPADDSYPPASTPTGSAALEPAAVQHPGGPQPTVPTLAGPETARGPQHGPQHEPQPAQASNVPEGPASGEQPVEHTVVAASPILDGSAPRLAPPRQPRALPMPGSERAKGDTRSPGVSVQTLGQGVHVPQLPARRNTTPVPPAQQTGPGRRRKLATPPVDEARHAPQPSQGGREFMISAPAAGLAEGPEPLDGPNGAVEVTDGHTGGGLRLPLPADDELPPEPMDNPRRLLVWPEPDTATEQALTDRGYRPVIVHSREEVDAQIAAYPAALFVDPLTGPITRTALQSLRAAAVAAEVPVLVTAGLGQASREAAYGADPAVLLKALAPRDSEQHPPRVLLVAEQPAIAGALVQSLERRGMQAAHAATDTEAVAVAAQIRPNLVVMDLDQVRRQHTGIIDWLRVNGLLNRTPFVVYTAAEMDPSLLPHLASGETVLFLAERSTNPEVQARIVDLLARIEAR